MIIRILIGLLVIVITRESIFGQNLVKNPSLEIYNNRIIDGWQIVAGTPDIATRHNEIPPKNLFFNPFAVSSDHPMKLNIIQFGNICFCQGFNAKRSEVIQAELLEPLKRRKEYEISLYVIKNSPTDQAITEVSIHISRKMLPTADFPFGYRIPYIVLQSTPYPSIMTRQEWIKVKGIYVAKGGEKYISIGNFVGANQDVLNNLKGNDLSMYYCYDNVSIIPLESALPDEEITIMPSPTSDSGIIADTVPKTIILEDANFAFNKDELQSLSFPILDKVVDFLKKNSSFNINISGHTDNIGNHENNLKLSENRAKAVMKYILSKGISAERIAYQGFGETRPKESNESEAGRAKNRRVEINLIKD